MFDNLLTGNVKALILILLIGSLIVFNGLWIIVTDLYNSIVLLVVWFFFGDSVPRAVEKTMENTETVKTIEVEAKKVEVDTTVNDDLIPLWEEQSIHNTASIPDIA